MTLVIDANVRENTGQKGVLRALRKESRIPGVVYGGKKQDAFVSVERNALIKHMQKSGYLSRVYALSVGKTQDKVLIRDVQMDPVRDTPIHIDFMRVAPGTQVHVSIPLQFKDMEASPGIKRGGILNVVVHNLEVSADADAIPGEITISLAGRKVGESIHLSDITLPEKIRILHLKDDQTLATIVSPSGLTSSDAEEAAEGEVSEA
jgi:large subunit ribosomal protein L25